jgi:hypothetical protein
MSDDGRSGVSPWLVGLVGFFLYRRGRRRAERKAEGGRRGSRRDRGPLRDVQLPDGRVALQVTTSLFAQDPASDHPGRDGGRDGGEVWRRVPLDGTGTAASQEAFALTLGEVAPGAREAEDVPVVLMPLGTRRRVNAVDVYATGGRLGHLPAHAVRSVGASIRATQEADGRPCAVQARIMPAASGQLIAEVLLPETFTPGGPSAGR